MGAAQPMANRPAGVAESAVSVRNVSLSFAGVRTLHEVSIDVPAGRLVSLIGPNGAGKTSLINCLTGYYRPSSGSIVAFGTDITRWRPHRIARAGIVRTYQNIGLFSGLTVLDNLLVARHLTLRAGLISGGFGLSRCAREELAQREVVEGVLESLDIARLRHTVVGRLPYGLRKRVELGRALAMEPRLLLLDEPMAGMAAEEKAAMSDLLVQTRDRGVTVLLVEHDMTVVMGNSEAIAVLDFGQLIAYGTPEAVASDPAVVAAYLGVDAVDDGEVIR